MSPGLPAMATAAVVLVAAGLVSPARRARQVPRVAPLVDEAPRSGLVTRLGSALRQRVGREPEPGLDRKVGWMVVGCCLTIPLSPTLAVLAAVGCAVASTISRRRVARRSERDLVDELPEVVDLLNLSVSAGHTVPLAVAVVADHGRGRFASDLDQARRRAAQGSELAHELDLIPGRLGEPVRPVVRALSGALRDGAPLAPALDRVANDVRTLRRRAAEERARRVSVRLLFPLVCCTLPAFALLTVVPLLISTLRGISL